MYIVDSMVLVLLRKHVLCALSDNERTCTKCIVPQFSLLACLSGINAYAQAGITSTVMTCCKISCVGVGREGVEWSRAVGIC